MVIYKSNRNISIFHENFLKLYSDKYPTHKIFVEYQMADYIDYKNKYNKNQLDILTQKRCRNLYLDTYNMTNDTLIEIDGEQHDKYNSFFHRDSGGFDRQKGNDNLKETVCTFYGTKIIRIKSLKDINKEDL